MTITLTKDSTPEEVQDAWIETIRGRAENQSKAIALLAKRAADVEPDPRDAWKDLAVGAFFTVDNHLDDWLFQRTLDGYRIVRYGVTERSIPEPTEYTRSEDFFYKDYTRITEVVVSTN